MAGEASQYGFLVPPDLTTDARDERHEGHEGHAALDNGGRKSSTTTTVDHWAVQAGVAPAQEQQRSEAMLPSDVSEGASFSMKASDRRTMRRGSTSFKVNLNESSHNCRSQATVKSMMAFSSIKKMSAEDKARFQEESAQIRRRLKTISRSTIDPRSRFIRMWDVVTMLALVFTAFVTPFHVAFIRFSPDVASSPIDFTLNRIIDLIFFIDIIINFFLPYQASRRAKPNLNFNRSPNPNFNPDPNPNPNP